MIIPNYVKTVLNGWVNKWITIDSPEAPPPPEPLTRQDMIALRDRVIRCAGMMNNEPLPDKIDNIAETLVEVAMELMSRARVGEDQ